MSESECAVDRCDIFDFMIHHVGLTVVHPGGLSASSALAEACGIRSADRVLDIGCGRGTTAIFLAHKYGCGVTGIDLSKDLVSEARSLARRSKVSHLTRFETADAHSLPFADDQFDVVVCQAVLVLVKDKSQVIREALRVTRPGGRLGWLELSWQREPPEEFLRSVSDVLCAYCMQNVETFESWTDRLQEAGLAELTTSLYPLPAQSLRATLRDEGVRNTAMVMLRTLLRASVRARTRRMNDFFRAHADVFAYGVFVGRKSRA